MGYHVLCYLFNTIQSISIIKSRAYEKKLQIILNKPQKGWQMWLYIHPLTNLIHLRKKPLKEKLSKE